MRRIEKPLKNRLVVATVPPPRPLVVVVVKVVRTKDRKSNATNPVKVSVTTAANAYKL